MQQGSLGVRNVGLSSVGHNEPEEFSFKKDKSLFLRILHCLKDGQCFGGRLENKVIAGLETGTKIIHRTSSAALISFSHL